MSITIGIFRDSVSANILTGGRAHFPTVFEFFLSPYFSSRKRCIGIGEYFKYGDAKFKVLGAFPSYGIVGKNTAIFCSQLLSAGNINKLHILPINGQLVNPSTFNSVISPFFKYRPQHIYTGQYLYLGRQEYIIIASQPTDGVVASNAQFYFEGEVLYPLSQVVLSPFFEDLPVSLKTLPKEALIEEIINYYLLPYFQGSRRYLIQNQEVMIDGVGFLVEYAYPPKGVVMDNTTIAYEGSFKSRHVQPEIVFVPRSGYINPQINELNRQLFQLQLLMQGMDVQTEQTDERIVGSLPTHTLTNLPSNPEAARCMICLNDYDVGDTVKTLPCFHMFHPDCIHQWLERSKLCPLCKTSVEIIA